MTDPTPEEIAEACRVIREGWSEKERARRDVQRPKAVNADWGLPCVAMDQVFAAAADEGVEIDFEDLEADATRRRRRLPIHPIAAATCRRVGMSYETYIETRSAGLVVCSVCGERWRSKQSESGKVFRKCSACRRLK